MCKAMTQLTAPTNVDTFRGMGAGKSSLTNMIVGKDVADISSDTISCMFKRKSYEVEEEGVPLVLWELRYLRTE